MKQYITEPLSNPAQLEAIDNMILPGGSYKPLNSTGLDLYLIMMAVAHCGTPTVFNNRYVAKLARLIPSINY